MTGPRARIAAALHSSARVLLVSHVAPDGDALGSTLALALALEALGKRVVVASEDGLPPAFAFLPGAERIVHELPPDAAFDAAVTIECSTPQRCGRFAPVVLATPLVIAIDHHQSHVSYGHLEDWDPAAAAVAEQVAELIGELGVSLDVAMATALLAALVSDTGAFRFPTVHPGTLRLAARLMDAGAPLGEIVAAVYERRSLASARLLGYALLRTAVAADGALAYSTLNETLMRAAGAGPDDSGGIAGTLRTLQGVRVAILFEESGGEVRVSIRARDGARAHAIAERFGGGGHCGAAGCVLPGPLAEAVPRVLAAAEAELRREGEPGRR
ncbi:MAG: DHHA1 domain-containing protein [Armatimonadota bacterium]|nr:DHHA1 domain-containing protein [Armatimonadota bacterium]MDR7426855.1 DHHA1 domain-containing protein [Armatimonadota bacterium]MDR7464646.1 DHHA1 domain-containing protein [Armatimonadota bacterium]MDR7468802.1 DHHA1 domain-containing protein [Armatimonadota bacterium]MDR7473677.1 DHHA1 domain-containing protein [Armatimonadota bacterium]